MEGIEYSIRGRKWGIMANTGHLLFIGRQHLLEKCRAAVDAGISIQLLGEHGVGKSALARRIHSEALYIAHVTPAKDLLTAILKECYRRGRHDVGSKDDEEMNEATLERTLRKMDVKAATAVAVQALKERRAILVLDNFDEASATVVRLCCQLADVERIRSGWEMACSRVPFLSSHCVLLVPIWSLLSLSFLVKLFLIVAHFQWRKQL